MMRRSKYDTARFRRWSRSPYAAFASLHRQVSIGHLCAPVADASMRKLRKACSADFEMHAAGRCGNDSEPEQEPLPAIQTTGLMSRTESAVAECLRPQDNGYAHFNRKPHGVCNSMRLFYHTHPQ